jgi:hypothetical protein
VAQLEQTGVDLQAKNASQFNSALDSAKNFVQKFVDTAQGGTKGVSNLNVMGAALAVTVGNILTRALSAGASAIEDIGQRAILSVARFNTMRTAAEFLGEGVGKSKTQVDDLIESIQKYGITDDDAADAVSQFSRYNLDLAKTVDLAKEAQDASVLTGKSVTETYNQMVYAIEMANMRALRQAGIFADVAKSERELAESLGIATTDLTEENKVQATLNATLEAGTRIQGLYNQTNKYASTILANLPTQIDELLHKIGTPFQSALTNGAKAVSNLVTTATSAFSEGGTLYPAITALGSNINGLIDHFVDLAKYAVNSTSTMSGDVSTNLTTLVNNAFAWGYNLVDNFGSGMIQGAVSVLNALTYIGNLITGQLESNSPPKLLPNLANWGAAAMKSYMSGWGKADFSVFDEIAGTIESSLRAATGSKDTGLVSRILGDRSAIAGALETVRSLGDVTDQVLTKLYASTHTTDAAMKNYLKTTLELAVANDKVTAAQNALNAITKKYDDILAPLKAKLDTSSVAADNLDDQRKITQLQMVINDVNATAADKARAKLEIDKLQTGIQIRNIEEKQTAETTAAQTALDNATTERDAVLAQQEAAKALVEEHTKENELLKQQKTLLEQLAKAAEQAAKAGTGSKTNIPTTPSTRSSLGSLFDIKNADKTGRLGGLTITNPFSGIKTSIDDLTTAISNLNKAWAPATTATKPFFDWMNKNMPGVTKAATIFLTVSTVLFTLVKVFGIVATAIAGLSNPITATIVVVALAIAIWATWGDKISAWATNTFNSVIQWAANVGGKIQSWRDETVPKINGWVTDTSKKISGWASETWKTFTGWATDTITSIGNWVTDTSGKVTGWTADVGTKIQTWRDETALKISGWATDAEGTITTWIANVGTDFDAWVTASYNNAVSWAENIVQGLTDGLAAKWEAFKTYFKSLIDELPDWIKKLLGISSPSKVFADIGANMILGLTKGIMDNTKLPQLALQASINGMVSQPGGAGTVSHISSNYSNVNNWNLTMQTVQQARSVSSSFEMMRLLSGG